MNTAIKNRRKIHHLAIPYLSSFSVVMAFLVLLLLLAISITSPIARLPGPSVKLPHFKSEFATIASLKTSYQHPRNADAIVLTITRNLKFFLNDRPVLPEHLKMELERLQDNTKYPMLYIRADQAIPYSWIIWASCRLRELDIHTAYLTVRAKAPPYERIVRVQLPDWSPPPIIDYSPIGIADGEYFGLEKMSSLTPDDPETKWFHENSLIVRNNEIILDKVPITIRQGKKEYSASDGRFLTYRGRFIAGDWELFLKLRLCQSDYVAYPIGKHDQYTEIKTYKVDLYSVKNGFEVGGVRYQKANLDINVLRRIEDLLKTEPFEKARAGLSLFQISQ